MPYSEKFSQLNSICKLISILRLTELKRVWYEICAFYSRNVCSDTTHTEAVKVAVQNFLFMLFACLKCGQYR